MIRMCRETATGSNQASLSANVVRARGRDRAAWTSYRSRCAGLLRRWSSDSHWTLKPMATGTLRAHQSEYMVYLHAVVTSFKYSKIRGQSGLHTSGNCPAVPADIYLQVHGLGLALSKRLALLAPAFRPVDD